MRLPVTSAPAAPSGAPTQPAATAVVAAVRTLIAQLPQHGTHVTLAKTKVTQCRKGLRMSVDRLGFSDPTVRAAVGMPKANSRRRRALDEELAAMASAMVRRTA